MNKIFICLYLLIPSLLNTICCIMAFDSLPYVICVILSYLITAIGIFVFFKFKPCSFYVLLGGLLLSPLPTLALLLWELSQPAICCGALWAAWLLVASILCIVLYVLPFTVISVIAKRLRWW